MTDAGEFSLNKRQSGESESHRFPNKVFDIPPAAELCPDTYEQAIDKTLIYICIMSPSYLSSDKIFNENADCITKVLEQSGYDTNTQLKRKRFSKKIDLDEFLKEVKTTDFFNYSAVLLFWFGETDQIGSNGMISLKDNIYDIRDLWKPFVAADSLRRKPKINMFFTYLPLPSDTQADSACTNIKKTIDPYEAPGEADVLIIYQKTDIRKQPGNTSYFKSFADNMITLGRQYHISNLASININVNPKQGQHYPIVVSTLTRKFFIQKTVHRGIHLELDELTKGIQFNLNLMLQGGTTTSPSTIWRMNKCLNQWKKKSSGARPSSSTAPVTPRRNSMEKIEFDSNNMPKLVKPTTSVTPVPQKPTKPRSRLSSISKPIDPKSPKKWQY